MVCDSYYANPEWLITVGSYNILHLFGTKSNCTGRYIMTVCLSISLNHGFYLCFAATLINKSTWKLLGCLYLTSGLILLTWDLKRMLKTVVFLPWCVLIPIPLHGYFSVFIYRVHIISLHIWVICYWEIFSHAYMLSWTFPHSIDMSLLAFGCVLYCCEGLTSKPKLTQLW